MSVFNFGAGPAMLPIPVRDRVKEEWLNWRGLGTSVAEIGHRTEIFRQAMVKIENDLRELLAIPNNYKVLFLQGGGQGQFALVPMNLLGKNPAADYLIYGLWSEKAYQEAERYGAIKAINLCNDTPPFTLLSQAAWQPNNKAAYLHYCSNETVDGIKLNYIPQSQAPLAVDMSSDILSEPIDINRYGIIYACAQKNAGITGITIVIIREDLLEQAMPLTPSVFNYKKQAIEHSLYNTVPTFPCYIAGLVFEWMKAEGGLTAIASRNQEKAARLYNVIDSMSDFYFNKVAKPYRSIMNVTFFLKNIALEKEFIVGAEAAGLMYLQGHRTRGGFRASIYNAMPEEGINRLIEFMREFAKRKR